MTPKKYLAFSHFRLLLFLCLGYLFPLSLLSQEPFYIQYDESSGLPSSEVFGVGEDKDGFMWFTTDRGLAKFNGYEFEVFDSPKVSKGNSFLGIRRYDSTTIWLTTLDGSVCMLKDGELDRFERKGFSPYRRSDNGLFDLYMEGDGKVSYRYNNHAWTYGVLDTKTGSTEAKDMHTLPVVNIEGLDSCLTLLQIAENRFWLNITQNTTPPWFLSNLAGHKNKVWAFSKYSWEGSTIGIIENNQCREITKLPTPCFKVYFNADGTLWAYGEAGIYRIKDLNENAKAEHFLKNVNVFDFVQDREKNYWVCTQRDGVFRIPSFDLLDGSEWIEQSRTNLTNVLSVDSLLVLENNYKGLIMLFPSGKKIILPCPVVGGSWTNSLFYNKWAKEISVVNITHFGQQAKDGSEWLKPVGISISGNNLVLSNGDLLVSKTDEFYFQRDNEVMFHSSEANIIDRILYRVEDDAHTLWLGGIEGLYRIDNYNYSGMVKMGEVHPALNTRVSDIKPYQSDLKTAWIATVGTGLIFTTPDTAYNFTHEDGLSSDIIQCLHEENDSVLWIGTVNGLNRLVYQMDDGAPVLSRIEVFGRDNGLPSNRINDITWWNGRLCLATNEGFVAFVPENLKPNAVSPKILLEKVVVNNDEFPVGEEPVLNPDQRNILFSFTGVSRTKPFHHDFYRYRLEKDGEEQGDWSFTNDRSVQFTNLQQGDYTFVLQARNNHGVWSDVPVNYSFSVLPHYSETWWFKGGMAASGGLVLALIFLARLRATRREFRYKLKLRDSELRLLRTQMSPHFVFNLLNGIQRLIFDRDFEQASFYLSKLAHLMRSSLDFSKMPYITLKEEIDFLENYLFMERSRFEDKIDIEFEINEELRNLSKGILVPPLMIQPLLENAIKHGISGLPYRGVLQLSITKNNDQLCFRVEDNGWGLKNSPTEPLGQTTPHALGILRDRIKLLNEEWAENKASIKITDLGTKHKDQSGVRIDLAIPIVNKKGFVQ